VMPDFGVSVKRPDALCRAVLLCPGKDEMKTYKGIECNAHFAVTKGWSVLSGIVCAQAVDGPPGNSQAQPVLATPTVL
jgi:hypothetical protein